MAMDSMAVEGVGTEGEAFGQILRKQLSTSSWLMRIYTVWAVIGQKKNTHSKLETEASL